MKKLVLIFSAISLFGIPILAQSDYETETIGDVAEITKEDGVEPNSLVISVAGVINDQVDQDSTLGGEDSSLRAGLGVLVEANIQGSFGIETGVLFLNRQYKVTGQSARLIEESKRLHVPILARAWVNDYFSMGLGPFLAIRTGDDKTVVSNNSVGLSTSAEEVFEFGLDAAATFNFAVADKTGLFFEGRYSMVLSDKTNESVDQLSGLAGIKLDI